MRLACNISKRGKAIRLIYGCGFLLAGLVLLVVWTIQQRTIASWIISVGLILGGAFAIFEAYSGWCILRAMGLKTPM